MNAEDDGCNDGPQQETLRTMLRLRRRLGMCQARPKATASTAVGPGRHATPADTRARQWFYRDAEKTCARKPIAGYTADVRPPPPLRRPIMPVRRSAPRKRPVSPPESSVHPSIPLHELTPNRVRLPLILEEVRRTYGASNERAYSTAVVVGWVACYLQFYPTKPLGLLDEAHATAFLSHLGRQATVTRRDQERAHDAIVFFHVNVLGQPHFAPPRRYVKPPQTQDGAARSRKARPPSFWSLPSETNRRAVRGRRS